MFRKIKGGLISSEIPAGTLQDYNTLKTEICSVFNFHLSNSSCEFCVKNFTKGPRVSARINGILKSFAFRHFLDSDPKPVPLFVRTAN